MNVSTGFIGLGIIGLPMAQRLLEQGLPVVVWNRTAAKADALASKGVARAASPRELAGRCDVVVTMVSDDAALREVAFGAEGIGVGISSGKVHLDMSTVHPGTTEELTARYAGVGAHFVHAPVLGNHRAAATGELLIFAGGAPAALEKCRPVFTALGKKVWTWDQPQKATCVKLSCNLLLGGMVELLAESLLLVSKAGVAPQSLLEIVGMSALAAPMYQSKGRMMTKRDFTPSFYLRHMLKDLRCAAGAGEHVGASLPATQAVRDAFARAEANGLAERDYSAIYEWLETASAHG